MPYSGNHGKISKSYILTLPPTQGHVMSVKWEQPLDVLHSKFGYYITIQTLNIALNIEVGRNYKQTDGRTDSGQGA